QCGAHIYKIHFVPISNLRCDHQDISRVVADFYGPADVWLPGHLLACRISHSGAVIPPETVDP
ncbi:hypothetical protein Q4R00_19330, partial [Morganella morganii]